MNVNQEASKDKISPNVLNLSRANTKTISELVQFYRLSSSYPPDRRFSTIIDDNKIDNNQTGIVDLAFGIGCEFLNLKGFLKSEKVAKVIRYCEIIDELR